MNQDLIETICIENYYINKDDYTSDLEAFSWFRATNLTDEENINYETVSPLIIENLYNESNYKAVYALLYTNFVQQLTNYISELETEKARKLFTVYLKDLEQLYIRDYDLNNNKIK